jgi:hypothetical protein
MVILVLCQRGTDMEHKCRQKLQLIELNLFDNPFLRVRKHGIFKLSKNKLLGKMVF